MKKYLVLMIFVFTVVGCSEDKIAQSKKIVFLSEKEIYELNYSPDWLSKCASEKEQGMKNPNCLISDHTTKLAFHEKYMERKKAVEDGSFFKD